jgi:phage terminase small subunit
MPRLRNERHESFCRHYVSSWDWRKAGAAVGYAVTSSDVLACEPQIRYRVAELSDALLKSADITAQRVMLELARVGFSDIRKIVDDAGQLRAISDLDDDIAAAISGIEVETRYEQEMVQDLATGEMVRRALPVVTTKIKKSDKVAALNILAKHFKLVGDDGDGVNALASALSDRLIAARKRIEGVNYADVIDNHAPRLGSNDGGAVSESGDGDRADAQRQRDDRREP